MSDDPAEAGARRPRVVVVGAGVAGLAAAQVLARDGRADVVVVEGSPRTGGKLWRGEIAGVETDLGAEALLARRPEAVALIEELGLGAEIVHPRTLQAGIWSRGSVRPLPAGHVMGVPTRLRSLAASGVLGPGAVARAALDELIPASRLNGDTSVAGFVGARMGQAVVDRLVEPLLGGVYAGRADELSLRATLPQVAAVASSGSLMRALRRRSVASAGTASDAPVFAGLPGGVGRLAEALTGWLLARGVDVQLGSAVRGLERTAGGWRLTVGSAAEPRSLEADAVVLALPATPASRLVRGVIPAAAADLGSIEYSSMAIVTLAYPPSAFERPLRDRGLSGFLVPAVERRLIKAATFSSVKWGWYPDGVVIVRCSIGRHRDVEDLQRSDDELSAGARGDLAVIVGVRGVPIDSAVTRWGGALPQYAVGHLDRVARIKAGVAEVGRLAVCGAAYDGLGIPACIASGQAAATQILQGLFAEGQ